MVGILHTNWLLLMIETCDFIKLPCPAVKKPRPKRYFVRVFPVSMSDAVSRSRGWSCVGLCGCHDISLLITLALGLMTSYLARYPTGLASAMLSTYTLQIVRIYVYHYTSIGTAS